MPDSSVVPTL